tara:strand:+ start:413 stop:607 length:195 start_codon:yes stop_codon:yes gene_type:complete
MSSQNKNNSGQIKSADIFIPLLMLLSVLKRSYQGKYIALYSLIDVLINFRSFLMSVIVGKSSAK